MAAILDRGNDVGGPAQKSCRLGIHLTHPIQYYSPWFRRLSELIELEVFYAHRQDKAGQSAAGFGVSFDWDVPLLEGYSHRWLDNVARRPGVADFWGCDTPEIFDVVRGGRFDAFLVVGWNHKSSIQTVRACWREGVPVLMRGDSQLPGQRYWCWRAIKYPAYRLFLPRLDAHLYVGQRNRSYLLHYGVRDDQLFFSPHFVDTGFFRGKAAEAVRRGENHRVREELRIPPHAFVFLFVGKMIARKRPHDFVRACLELTSRRAGSAIHAILVGDGPLRSELEVMARPAAEHIHFAGFRNQSELPRFYAASDALVLCSDGRETWGLVVNEAASSGIPAVVSDAAGCAPDMIDESLTGYTFPVGDVDALASRMLQVKSRCEGDMDTVRRQLAIKTLQYSINTATQGLLDALGAVVGRTQRSAGSLCHTIDGAQITDSSGAQEAVR